MQSEFTQGYTGLFGLDWFMGFVNNLKNITCFLTFAYLKIK